ncbi:glycoside hydrolase superfamily [Powellomyces hirtus]|nr:glycoside hydrolase superfamily [Powellomyces hirtus]
MAASPSSPLKRPILQKDGHFHDEHGRILHLRGVNLSGNSKLPTSPPGSTHIRCPQFFNHADVSFVGRPFPVNEADEHFGRLRSWGLTFVRFLVTWEALEHDGPGIYDDEFISYLESILTVAAKYGIQVFIDPHQDTWSRFSGGSGAPGWTFEVVDMDVTHFMETGAAYVHQSAQPEDSGHTAWPTNYQKLASSTMFTVFFGGDVFAPDARYRGEPVQEFLQRHFCAAFEYLAKRLHHLPAVIGFEVINEPHFGYIGLPSLHSFDPLKELHYGPVPSALQSMALGAGIPQEIDVYVKSWPWPTRKDHKKIVNEVKVSAWLPGKECIWKSHGVWSLDPTTHLPRTSHPDYFTHRRDGTPINFYTDCYVPFIKRFTHSILAVDPTLLVFFEPIPNEDPPQLRREDDHAQLVYSPHWYDLKVLFNKAFNSRVTHDVQGLSRGTKNVLAATYFGAAGVKRNYRGQIRNIITTGRATYPSKAILFGECGLPMDMNEKQAYETGDYTQHTIFLDAMIGALEEECVSFTLWNYNPRNDNVWGDHCLARRPADNSHDIPTTTTTGEDETPLSPITPFDITAAYFNDHQTDPAHTAHNHHIGGRALDAVIRPYAAKIPGTPHEMKFELETLKFRLAFTTTSNHNSNSPTTTPTTTPIARTAELFIPTYHYPITTSTLEDPRGFTVSISDGTWEYDREQQLLTWVYDETYTGRDETDPNNNNNNIATGFGAWWFKQPAKKMGDEEATEKVLHTITITPTQPPVRDSWWGRLWRGASG